MPFSGFLKFGPLNPSLNASIDVAQKRLLPIVSDMQDDCLSSLAVFGTLKDLSEMKLHRPCSLIPQHTIHVA